MYSMGALAEYAVVTATDVFRLPAGMPLAESCILGCAIMTAYGAVKHQAEVKPGDTVAVIGAGGVGSNVVQLARLFGAAEVIAVDIRDDKLAEVQKLGATRGVNASKGDPVAQVQALTGGRGVDVAIEALGRPETVSNAFLMTRDGGRTVGLRPAPGPAAASHGGAPTRPPVHPPHRLLRLPRQDRHAGDRLARRARADRRLQVH